MLKETNASLKYAHKFRREKCESIYRSHHCHRAPHQTNTMECNRTNQRNERGINYFLYKYIQTESNTTQNRQHTIYYQIYSYRGGWERMGSKMCDLWAPIVSSYTHIIWAKKKYEMLYMPFMRGWQQRCHLLISIWPNIQPAHTAIIYVILKLGRCCFACSFGKWNSRLQAAIASNVSVVYNQVTHIRLSLMCVCIFASR